MRKRVTHRAKRFNKQYADLGKWGANLQPPHRATAGHVPHSRSLSTGPAEVLAGSLGRSRASEKRPRVRAGGEPVKDYADARREVLGANVR